MPGGRVTPGSAADYCWLARLIRRLGPADAWRVLAAAAVLALAALIAASAAVHPAAAYSTTYTYTPSSSAMTWQYSTMRAGDDPGEMNGYNNQDPFVDGYANRISNGIELYAYASTPTSQGAYGVWRTITYNESLRVGYADLSVSKSGETVRVWAPKPSGLTTNATVCAYVTDIWGNSQTIVLGEATKYVAEVAGIPVDGIFTLMGILVAVFLAYELLLWLARRYL